MENASKALLIAAAVLIVVLLIAFGMSIFNQASDAGDSKETSEEITAGIDKGNTSILYNKIISITGYPSGGVKKISYSDLEILLDLIEEYNARYKGVDGAYLIYTPYYFEGKGNLAHYNSNQSDEYLPKLLSIAEDLKNENKTIYFKVLGQGYDITTGIGKQYVKLGIFFSENLNIVNMADIKNQPWK